MNDRLETNATLSEICRRGFLTEMGVEFIAPEGGAPTVIQITDRSVLDTCKTPVLADLLHR